MLVPHQFLSRQIGSFCPHQDVQKCKGVFGVSVSKLVLVEIGFLIDQAHYTYRLFLE